MKHIIRWCILSVWLGCAAGVSAEQGDIVSDKYSAAWQIAASGLSTLMTKMDGLPDAYQAVASMNEWIPWIRLEYAQPGSLNKIFPDEVYAFVMGRFVGYNYSKTAIHEDYQPPDCTGGSGQITCDEDTVSIRPVVCYAWNFVTFTEIAAGSLNAGTWTFSGLAAGYYVCTFDSNFDALPTQYLTVN